MKLNGPVDQSGMIAAFATRKSGVQIPPGPLLFLQSSIEMANSAKTITIVSPGVIVKVFMFNPHRSF
jgi:hypothetical protein